MAAALLLWLMAGAAPAADEPDGDRLRHRDRAVTESDFKTLAPASPGVDVQRPAAPAPMSAPQKNSKALNPPAIDDRNYEQLRDETRARVPARSPEWIDHNAADPGASKLDPHSGRLRFGDGEHSRRPPAGKSNLRPQYRPGSGRPGGAPAGPDKPAAPGPLPVPYPNDAATSGGEKDDD